MVERYGVEFPVQSPEISARIEVTREERYGAKQLKPFETRKADGTFSVSEQECDVASSVKLLVGDDEVLTNDRVLSDGELEFDIVVPSRKIAIEFNGVWEHSEGCISSPSYHKKELDFARSIGYELIFVWEDDWKYRREIVLRQLAYKLHAWCNLYRAIPGISNEELMSTGARKLDPKIISGSSARVFLDEYHIQGAVSATRHFALVDADNDIKAVLSVRSPKSCSRQKRSTGTWEIVRYATSCPVQGGFSKLLKFAEGNLSPEGLKEWVSFSANDVSNGGLYRKCGFDEVAVLPPDYKYVGKATGWKRAPKEAFQRRRFREDSLFKWDESWTEHETALNNKLYRIYDAGKIKWARKVR